jgi:hypothetical protein
MSTTLTLVVHLGTPQAESQMPALGYVVFNARDQARLCRSLNEVLASFHYEATSVEPLAKIETNFKWKEPDERPVT